MITFNFWVWWLPIFLFYLMAQCFFLVSAAAYAAIYDPDDGEIPEWFDNILEFFIIMNVPVTVINALGLAAFVFERLVYGP